MPSPSTSLATLRPDLATFVEFDLAMDAEGFIGHQVLPVFEVGKQAATYGKIPIEQLLQNRDTARSPGSAYSRGKWTFGEASYACKENGAEEPVDDREANMYRDYFVAEQISAARAHDVVVRNCEKRIAAKVFNTTTWTGAPLTTTVAIPWTSAVAVPITNVEAAVIKVYDGSGLWPDTMIINKKVFRLLRNCPQVIDRINSSGAGSPSKAEDVTLAMLAAIFDLRKIRVAGGSKNTANEGQALAIEQIWSSSYCMICKTEDGPDVRKPCLGRSFHWAEDGSQVGGTIETYRDETIRGDVVRVRHDVDEQIQYAEAGHLLQGIV